MTFEDVIEMLILQTSPKHDGTHKCVYRDLLYHFAKMDYIHMSMEKLAGKYSECFGNIFYNSFSDRMNVPSTKPSTVFPVWPHPFPGVHRSPSPSQLSMPRPSSEDPAPQSSTAQRAGSSGYVPPPAEVEMGHESSEDEDDCSSDDDGSAGMELDVDQGDVRFSTV